MHYVYVYSSDGVPYYVGKGKGRRDQVHLSKAQNTLMQTACINETRAALCAGARVTIDRAYENLSSEDALQKEKELIAFYGRRSNGGLLVNKTSGGQGPSGVKRTQEEKERVSRQFKGVKLSDEHRRKISEWTKAHGVRPPVKYGAENWNAKKVTLKFPDGSVHTHPCLKEFCRDNGLNMSSVRNTLYEGRPLKRGPWAGLMIMPSPSQS